MFHSLINSNSIPFLQLVVTTSSDPAEVEGTSTSTMADSPPTSTPTEEEAATSVESDGVRETEAGSHGGGHNKEAKAAKGTQAAGALPRLRGQVADQLLDELPQRDCCLFFKLDFTIS